MNAYDDRAIDEQIRTSLADGVPPLVEQRLRSQLSDLRSQLASPRQTGRRRDSTWERSARWSLAAAAAGLALVAIYFALQPSQGLAQAAAKTLMQPWIHVRIASADKFSIEQWFAPRLGIAATASPESIHFNDDHLQAYYSYDPAQGSLYRLPESEILTGEASKIESMISLLSVLAAAERTPENPLERLTFLGKERDRIKVLKQKLEKVTESGQPWLDYHVTLGHADLPNSVQVLLRVDANTSLLRLCRMTGIDKGQPASREIQFDYPETGPADVYALGVPKSAPLIDRVPAGDMKRILSALQAGRERMDPYRAIFVNITEGSGDWWTYESPTPFYRKGDRFRADHMISSLPDLARSKPPAPNTDMGKWWQDRLPLYRFFPETIVRGSTSYSFQTETTTGADGSHHVDLVAVKEYTQSGEFFPPHYSMMPEFGCRPPMGIGGQDFDPVIDLHPADGPPGCILLSVRHTSERGRINDKGFGLPDETRYWLDPARDYIVLRWEMLHRDASGQETPVRGGSWEVEETARSPQGVWYATRIRRKNTVERGNGKSSDDVYHLYVDFNAALPDSLFDPPRPGRIQ